jgi:hypothetical protein
MPSVMRRRPSHWLRGAAAAALVAGASACSFLTAPGSPAPSAFEDASTWNAATLSARTKGQCAFMLTEPYVENFKVKNTTFWASDQFDGAQHCTGLAPSGPSVCTMASSNALTYSYPLYPPAAGTDPLGILSSGDTGLKAVISQSACLEDTSLCKFNGGESFWLGAHMESQGCIQFGVLGKDLHGYNSHERTRLTPPFTVNRDYGEAQHPPGDRCFLFPRDMCVFFG